MWNVGENVTLGNSIGSRDVVGENSCVDVRRGTIFKAEHAFERSKSREGTKVKRGRENHRRVGAS